MQEPFATVLGVFAVILTLAIVIRGNLKMRKSF